MAEIKPLKVDTTNEVARRWATGDYLGLLHGGFGGDFSATGPGFLYQATPGAVPTLVDLNARYATTIGDGVSTSIVVTHNLNTRDVGVEIYEAASTYDDAIVGVQRTSVNTITLIFTLAPALNSLRVVVTGVGTVTADGSYKVTPVIKTASYGVVAGDHMLVANHATVAVVFALPPATGSGRIYSLSNIGAADAVADGNGTDKINNELIQMIPQWCTLKIWDIATGVWVII